MNQLHSDGFMLQPWLFPILMFVGISILLSILSGWLGLAKTFKSGAPPKGERFNFVSGSMGMRLFPVHYGSCLFVTVNNEGLGLSTFFLFRLFSPALFIPWTEVESIESKRYLFFSRYIAIRLHNQWAVISLRGKAGEYAQQQYAKSKDRLAAKSPFHIHE